MVNINNTVFISYRRDVSSFIARAVFMDLRQHGFDVFMDVEGIDSGEFDRVLLNQIAARAHFVLILTPGSVERCANPHDWLRREIEHAITLQRNVVPLLANGFTFAGTEQYLIGTLSSLTKYNALNVPHDYFDAAMEKLRSRFLKQPVYGTILSTPTVDRTVVQQKLTHAIQQTTLTDEEKKAEEYFKQAVKKQSDDDLDRAIDDYTEANRLNPQHARAFNNRGGIRKAKGDLEGAIVDYSEAIHLNPEYWSAYSSRAATFELLGNTEAALADYTECIRLKPQDSAAYFNRGNMHYDQEDYTNALADYDEAVRLGVQDDATCNNRGEALFALGDYKRALADFEKSRSLFRNNLMTIAGISITLHALGNVEEARKQWQQLVTRDENYTNADWVGKELNWAKPLVQEARKLIDNL